LIIQEGHFPEKHLDNGEPAPRLTGKYFHFAFSRMENSNFRDFQEKHFGLVQAATEGNKDLILMCRLLLSFLSLRN
jgi:hypothetical protein